MFTEILKIKPQLDNSQADSMERNLNGRFGKVAKKFGKGLVDAIKGGAIAGFVVGLIDKVLNPLQQVQEAIEKALHNGDDLSTFAKQFNTTEGNLSRLQAFGKASGLDAEGVRSLLAKFQAAVTNTVLDPSQPSSVRNFVGKKDTAESFFEFIQSLQQIRQNNPTKANAVELDVFGERQVLKASSFLSADFNKLNTIFRSAGAPSAERQTGAAQWLGTLQTNKDTLAAVSDQKDLVNKSGLINDRTISGLARRDDVDLGQENKGLSKFDSLQAISIENQKLMNLAVNQFLKLAPLIADAMPTLVNFLGGGVKAVEGSRALKGLTPGAGKDK